jgi:predicted nucleic acid-binding protein
MSILLDSGILLRAVRSEDALYQSIQEALQRLIDRGEQPVTTLQNVSEFWNVCTRPVSARGGFGLSIEQAEQRVIILEKFTTVLPEPAGLYERWRELVIRHRVLGVQVHDAKLVAAMGLHGISQILTLNGRDFSRYPEIIAIAPENV